MKSDFILKKNVKDNERKGEVKPKRKRRKETIICEGDTVKGVGVGERMCGIFTLRPYLGNIFLF